MDTSRGRALLTAIAGGMAAGVIAAAVSRVAMRLLFLVDPRTAGVIVAESFAVGTITAAGTGAVLMAGVVSGALVGIVYAVAKPVRARGVARGRSSSPW